MAEHYQRVQHIFKFNILKEFCILVFLEKYIALPTIENVYIRSFSYGTKSHTVQCSGKVIDDTL